MEEPRFAQHLPSGELLDWAFRQNPSRRFSSPVSSDLIRVHWQQMDAAAVAQTTFTSEDPELLDWIADAAGTVEGVVTGLLRNPHTNVPTLGRLLQRGLTPAQLTTLQNSRTEQELGELLLSGHDLGVYSTKSNTWLAAAVAVSDDPRTFERGIGVCEPPHLHLLLAAILRTEPAHSRFPVRDALQAVADLEQAETTEGTWRLLGEHVAQRGDQPTCAAALATTTSTGLRVPLLMHGSVDLGTAFAGLDQRQRHNLLRRMPDDWRIRETDVVALIGAGATGELIHALRFTPQALTLLLSPETGAGEETTGAAVWQSDSDAELVRMLRRNTEAHRWAGSHLWRLGRIWGRLSNATRQSIAAKLDPVAVGSVTDPVMRSWLVERAPAETVQALKLNRAEVKLLSQRAERTMDAKIAWMAAHLAERPRERVRMAEIGLSGEHAADLTHWLRGAESGEIIRLWNLAEPEIRDEMAEILVTTVKPSPGEAWLDRIVGEMRIEWQRAPVPVQEAAARWFTARQGDPETWAAVWALYPEWRGTLEELLDAARDL